MRHRPCRHHTGPVTHHYRRHQHEYVAVFGEVSTLVPMPAPAATAAGVLHATAPYSVDCTVPDVIPRSCPRADTSPNCTLDPLRVAARDPCAGVVQLYVAPCPVPLEPLRALGEGDIVGSCCVGVERALSVALELLGLSEPDFISMRWCRLRLGALLAVFITQV